MAHILARLNGVKPEGVKKILKADAAKHAAEGLYLEHVWQNVDEPEEVFFLFLTTDLHHAKQFIDRIHTQERNDNPGVNLPHMTFLVEQ
jgi:hypothetical protein